MIVSAGVTNFRGIPQLEINDLAPLTLFVGPNGSGKSTMLEAIYAAGHSSPANALLGTYSRRPDQGDPGLWLLRDGKAPGGAEIRISASSGASRRVALTPSAEHIGVALLGRRERDGQEVRLSDGALQYGGGGSSSGLADPSSTPGAAPTRFVEPRRGRLQQETTTAFTWALQIGRRREFENLVRELVPGCVDVSILTTRSNNAPFVFLTFEDRVVPLASAGEGVVSLVQQALELVGSDRDIVLMEEPETYKHPSAIRLTAKAMWAAVRRGVQIIATTHSPYLIEQIAREGRNELDKVCAFAFFNQGGRVFTAPRRTGEHLLDAPGLIRDDLE